MKEDIDTFHNMYTCMGVWFTSTIVISEKVIWYSFGTRSITGLSQLQYNCLLFEPGGGGQFIYFDW